MKGKSWRSKAKRNLTIVLAIAILVSLPTSTLTLAQGPGPATSDESASSMGWGEEGIKEVGVAWINDFPGTSGDRSHWDESCDRFYNRLRNAGWTGRFRYTNWSVDEEDYKDESRGGREDSVVDRADIAMLCTHGSSAYDSFWGKTLSSVYFGTSNDDHHLVPGDAYQAFGDQDLEWLCFDSCSVLSDGGPAPYRNRGYWAATMNGLHLLLGFKNTMYVISTGDGRNWAKYMLGWKMWFPFVGWIWMRSPYKVTQAWFEAVDDLQPGGVCARVIAEEGYFFNDYLHGRGPVAPDYDDGDYTYWDHCSCTPPAIQLAPEVLAQIETLPVYEVVDRTVDEQYVLGIASAFEMSGTLGTDGEFYYMLETTGVETYTLQIDMATGGYKYRNETELWASPDEAPALPTADEARTIGDEFFTGAGRNLPGAAYHTGEVLAAVEEQVEVEQIAPEAQILEERVLSTTPVLFALSYGRTISATAGTAGGGSLQPTLSIVGPGARTKMYLGDLGDVLGAQGGSRDISATGEEVTIMDADKAWDLWIADPTIALAQIPWVADVISKTSETLGYYEHPHQDGQKELIPAWIFTADFYNEGVLLAEGVYVYIPAAAEYLPPDVSIESPEAGDTFNAGVLVTFQGSVLQHGKQPFTYVWSSSYDDLLGTGATITAPLLSAILENDVVSHTISLEVTDANGQKGTDSTTVLVWPTIYLPGILKSQ